MAMNFRRMGEGIARALDRRLFTSPPSWSRNPIHLATNRRLKPGITAAVGGALIGSAYLSATASVGRANVRGFEAGVMPISRYAADAMPNDPTLGASGDIVFGLRALSRRL